jgi:KDO2-lipid IV(A) lauroyltransferase
MKILKKRVALAHKNLEYALGDKFTHDQKHKIIKDLFGYMSESLIESIIFTKKDLEKNADFHGLDNLKKAVDKDKGVIILTAHFGAWEIGGDCIGSHLEDLVIIYKQLKNPYVNNFLIKNRGKGGYYRLVQDKEALRNVMRHLKRGGNAAILFDQNAAGDGMAVTFFGKPASTHSAPALFALKTGCSVVPAFIFKKPGFRKYHIEIHEPFPLIKSGDSHKDILDNTQQYNDFLESIVRDHPEHWFGWVHKRWSGRY